LQLKCVAIMSTMYKIRPILKSAAKDIELPSCMYKMPYLYEEYESKSFEPMAVDSVRELSSSPNGLLSRKFSPSAPIGRSIDRELMVILKRQEMLIASLDKLELQVSTSADNAHGPNGTKFVVTNLSSDERSMLQLIERQERMLKNLSILERDIVKIVGDIQPTVVTVAVAQQSSASTAASSVGASSSAKDVAVHAPIASPPRKVRQLAEHLRTKMGKNVLFRTLYHSSTIGLERLADFSDMDTSTCLSRADYDITFTVILSANAVSDVTLIVNPQNPAKNVHGESAVVQFLSQQLGVDQQFS